MSFLLWQREGDVRIGSRRTVLRAAEVPLLADARRLRDALQQQHDEQARRLADAEREARERGHASGLEEGRREALGHLGDALQSLATAAAREREHLRGEVGVLALQVVRKLLGGIAPDAVLVALAETAAADALPGAPLALVVHPQRADAVRQRLAAAAAAADGHGAHWEVRTDPACGLDDCRIDTDLGCVDVSLETQLAKLAAAWQADAASTPC